MGEVFARSGVVDDVGGDRPTVLTRCLRRDPRAGIALCPAAVPHHALDLQFLRSIDDDDRIKGVRPTALGKQRHIVDDKRILRRLLLLFDDAEEDQRMHDRLQPATRGIVGEHDRAQARPINGPGRIENLFAELGHDLIEPGCPGLYDLPSDRVSIDDDRSSRPEQIRDRALAHRDPTRQTHAHHGASMPNMRQPFVRGDRIALALPGSVGYVEAVIGLLAAGVVPIPLDPHLTPSERASLFEDLAPTGVIEDPSALESLRAAYPPGLPLARPMHVTSGTTGRPKGVWSGVLEEADAEALVAEERELWGFGPDDVNLVVSPLHHSAPLRFAMGTLLAGGRIVVPGAFDPDVITAAIRVESPTTMFCVPVHLQRLFAFWGQVGRPDLASFRLLAHAGAPCPEAVKHQLLEVFPPRSTWEFYGSTEGQFTACRSEEWLQRPGTVGRARPGRRMSADPDGTLWCGVPSYARFEYFGAPEKTAEAWRDTPRGPAFTVGDLGRIDDDGYVYLDGRRVDLIISGGVNVYPAEVEQVLEQVDGVHEIAVYGAADPEWGQRVCAAYSGSATPEQLQRYARRHLAPPKRPKEYHRVHELPRTATGKVIRRALADRLREP